jgi:hypothetical protein
MCIHNFSFCVFIVIVLFVFNYLKRSRDFFSNDLYLKIVNALLISWLLIIWRTLTLRRRAVNEKIATFDFCENNRLFNDFCIM